MYVLEFLKNKEIENIFDNDSKKIIHYLLKKVLFSQPELLPGDKKNNIQMTKEFLEQWTAQALGWKTIGSGNYPIDVYSDKLKIGADVKFISANTDDSGYFKKGVSNETSLSQNFKDTGNNLDNFFKTKSKKNILNGWITTLISKSTIPKKDYNLKNIYYFIFLRGGDSINLAIARINSEKIKNIEITHFSGRNGENKSAHISGYINNDFGEVKIYKSKKRMELRCNAQALEKNNFLIKWDFSNDLKNEKAISLRELVKDTKKFNKYIEKKSRDFFDIKK